MMINYCQRALLVTSQKIGIEVDTEKNKYVFKYREQIAGDDCNVQDRWPPFEILAELKFLGKLLTNENCMHGEIKSRLKSGNVF
jgi:hypothetical protein